MRWTATSGGWESAPYRLYRGTNGEWAAWVYGKEGSYIVQRGCATASRAKEICEAHHKRNAFNQRKP